MSDRDLRDVHPGPPPDSPVEQLPTHQAAANNNVTELANLIQEGSQLLGTDSKETPLHAAAKRGALDTLRWLLDNCPKLDKCKKTMSPLEKAGNGNSAAHYAAVYGHLEVLKVLIEHNMDISAQVVSQTDESGLSLISLATLQGDHDMTKWLVDNYPEVGEIPNANGDLAVHFAAAQGHLGILKLLVHQYGKEIAEKQDKNSTKPVYFASQEGQLTILDYLINELGVDPVAREKSGVSTVHAAVQAGQYKAVKWLVTKLGPKYILDKTIDGATPLHMAAAQGHTDILRYLLDNLENKGDVNVLDHIHATPAHDAAEYGQTQAMLLLLKKGADISIKDTESKTPYELAMEQNHPNVAAMIADLRDNGPASLTKYEKKKRSNTQPSSMMQPRTSHQEAEELSAAIKQSSHVQEQRKNQQMHRQESLKRMNERGLEEDGKTSAMSDEDEIEHTLGPQGDIYARPKKRKHRTKGGSRGGSDEDLLDDSTSHRSFSSAKQNSLLDAVLPLDDSTFASVNHETASNYSRPSRVRRYHDSDSEITSISSQYRDGRHNVPGFYPPYGYYPPGPPLPPRKGHHSSASSVHSSKTGRSRHQQGYPMMPYGAGPYGYYPMPYAPYGYPYPHYGQQQPGYRPKTTEDRMHLEALQQGQGGHMMASPMYYYNPQQRGRRSKLKKRSRSRQPSRDPSPHRTARKHTDTDIGYGPAIHSKPEESTASGAKGKGGGTKAHQAGFHPPAPPITMSDGPVQGEDEVVTFDSNFIMMKKSDTMDQVRQMGDTTLNLAKAPKHYDGRWDSYIMTDSEPEHDVDENYCVAFAAEAAAILAIGCVSGLKGLKKIRKGGPVQPEKAYLSSAWDEPPMPTKGHSRRGSLPGMADPTLMDVSPEDFAAREEMKGQPGWAGGEKKSKGKKDKKAKKGTALYRSASAEALDKQPQSELLAGEMEKQQAYSSVSRSFGQKILFDALGARESSMLNIASTSLAGSMMSLGQSSREEEEEDDFEDAIHIVHGGRSGGNKKTKRRNKEGVTTQPEKGQAAQGNAGRPKSGKKVKAKEEKARKEKEKEDRKREKKDAKRDKQRKKEEEKKTSKQAKEKVTETSTAAAVTSPKKPSPPVPVRSAPPPPKTPDALAPKETQRPKQPSPSLQQRRRPSPPAPYHEHKLEKERPTATSTPAQKEGVTPKKDRREKAQLKSSPTQPIRPPPSKQSSRLLNREEKLSSRTQPGPKHPKAEPTVPTQKRNLYFENESDEESGPEVKAVTKDKRTTAAKGVGTKVTETRGGRTKDVSSKPLNRIERKHAPQVKEEPKDPDLAELDDVLAQLENIQTGDLASWLTPNTVTNVDASESSEDSLPLIVPEKAPKAAPKQRPSPPRARQFGGSSSKFGSGLEEPPPPRRGTSPYQGRRRVREMGDEGTSGTAVMQRTRHGSPHPRRWEQDSDSGGSNSRSGGSNEKVPPPAVLLTHDSRHDTEGDAQHSEFEQNVMSTLEALQVSMSQLKGNPSITQTEITEQTQLQQQLIQNLVTYSQHDPQLVNRLLSLLTEKNQDASGLESSSNHQLEELQQKILGAHEKTYQETQEHFRTQEALQRAIQHTLEEQTQQQMKGMQANVDMFSKMMEEQLAEQQRKFEEELKRRETEERESREKKKDRKKSSKKKKKRRKHYSDSESSSSGSGSEGMVGNSGKAVTKPAVKMMEAKIYTQDLLQEEPATPTGKGKAKLVRRTTDMELVRTTDALSRGLPLDEEEEEDDEEMYFQHARPITLRRADIKVQRQDDYTPQRPPGTSGAGVGGGAEPRQVKMEVGNLRQAPAEGEKFEDFHVLPTRVPKQLERPEPEKDYDQDKLKYGRHVETNKQKPVGEDPLAGAGGELAAILKRRQEQIVKKSKERK